MNSFGTLFKVTLYGESHQPAIGVVIDGVPPGIAINHDKIKADLYNRNPRDIGTTPRKEADLYAITSGVFNGKTTGSPLHVMIENTNTKSKDYEALKTHYRPGHSDFVAKKKYQGFHDYRGGGRFSGRLTAPLVIAGQIAKQCLPFTFHSKLKQVGDCRDLNHLDDYLTKKQEEGDSVGGVVSLRVEGLPVGLGEPMFEKLTSHVAKILFSVPSVKGVEFGSGFEKAHLKGSEFNDTIIDEIGTTKTNHSGGVSGGVSNGNPLMIQVMVKPTSSIAKTQHTYDEQTSDVQTLNIKGRHDTAHIRRIPIVLENVTSIALLDLFLQYKAYQLNEK